jgi:hypothetical protein
MNNLFQLIKTLTPHEKRYFKLYAQRASAAKTNIYVSLFEAIDGFDVYAEEILLKKYRRAPFIKHFAAHKSYLYDAILKALREYNEENIMEWQIREDYYKIKLLASKGLDKQCLKLIEKTKPLVWQYEQFTTLEDTIELQLYLFGNCRIGNFDADILNELIAEKEKLLIKINDYKYILNNWHLINILFQNLNKDNIGNIYQKAKAILDHPEMQRDRTADDGLMLRLRYLACFELYYNGIGDAENCYKYNKLLVEHRKEIEKRQPHTNSDAMAVYFNFMVACYKYEKWEEMEIYLDLMKNYPCKTIEQQIRRFHNYSYCGLLLFVSTRNYAKAQEVVTEYWEGKAKFGTSVRLDFMIVIEAFCGLVAFFEGRYTKALEFWNDIINQPKHNTELRSQGAVRVYRLLLWIATKKWDYLESEVRNTRRFLQKSNLYNEHEEVLLKMIEKSTHQKFSGYSVENIDILQGLKPPELSETSIYSRFIVDMLQKVGEAR